MPRSVLSLILLLAMGLGLFAGPHPCHARQASPEPAKKACHMQVKSAGASTVASLSAAADHDCCRTSHGSLCEYACQMTAIAQAGPLALRIAPVARTAAEAPFRGLSPLPHGIDHIPLA